MNLQSTNGVTVRVFAHPGGALSLHLNIGASRAIMRWEKGEWTDPNSVFELPAPDRGPGGLSRMLREHITYMVGSPIDVGASYVNLLAELSDPDALWKVLSVMED